MIDKKRLRNVMEKQGRSKKPANPDMTLDIKNEEAEQKIALYLRESTGENLNSLILVLRKKRVLVPANLSEDKKPSPCLLKSPERGSFLPVYTSREQVPQEPKSAALINMPFLAANHIAYGQGEQVAGIVINPFSQNLIFKRSLLEKIEETEKQIREKGQPKKMQLTPEQYMMFERKQFEFGFLPKRFFAQGQEMMDALCEEKEEYIDRFFEECYQQKRMYPYLPEDFSVTVMNISEELLVVRIDLPLRDMGVPSCFRVYLVWNSVAAEGRYFTIENSQNLGKSILGEFQKDWKHIVHGEAPSDGAQLQSILDLVTGTDK